MLFIIYFLSGPLRLGLGRLRLLGHQLLKPNNLLECSLYTFISYLVMRLVTSTTMAILRLQKSSVSLCYLVHYMAFGGATIKFCHLDLTSLGYLRWGFKNNCGKYSIGSPSPVKLFFFRPHCPNYWQNSLELVFKIQRLSDLMLTQNLVSS